MEPVTRQEAAETGTPRPQPKPGVPAWARQQAEDRAREARRPARQTPATASGASSGGTPGSGGMRSSDGGEAERSNYAGRVVAHLNRHKQFPRTAMQRRVNGTVMVRFSLARDGRVTSARLQRGSGHRVLDEAALAMVRRADPFPPIPPGLGRNSMSFTAPIEFHLN